MKKYLAAATVAVTLLSVVPAYAGVGFLFGLSVTTGGSLGVSANALSNNKQDRFVGAAGVSFYPLTGRRNASKFGLSLGGGYEGNKWATVAGWDFVQRAPVVTGGYAATK